VLQQAFHYLDSQSLASPRHSHPCRQADGKGFYRVKKIIAAARAYHELANNVKLTDGGVMIRTTLTPTPLDAFADLDQVRRTRTSVGRVASGHYRIDYPARAVVPEHIKPLRVNGRPKSISRSSQDWRRWRKMDSTCRLISNAPFYDVNGEMKANVSRAYNQSIARILKISEQVHRHCRGTAEDIELAISEASMPSKSSASIRYHLPEHQRQRFGQRVSLAVL
jgi:hypothetical protein